MRFLLAPMLSGTIYIAQTFGIWTVNAARSTFSGDRRPKSLTVRIEPHAKGEVFTMDRVESDGRMTSSSTLLYLDGSPRDVQEPGCSGTQLSRRIDVQTVEILRTCGQGWSIRWVWRTRSRELVLEITEKHSDGRRFERQLVLERK